MQEPRRGICEAGRAVLLVPRLGAVGEGPAARVQFGKVRTPVRERLGVNLLVSLAPRVLPPTQSRRLSVLGSWAGARRPLAPSLIPHPRPAWFWGQKTDRPARLQAGRGVEAKLELARVRLLRQPLHAVREAVEVVRQLAVGLRNTKGYSSTDLAMGFADVRAGTQNRRGLTCGEFEADTWQSEQVG